MNTAPDSDGDELPDPIDNCPTVMNIMQDDLDRDGVGDACDRQACGNGVLEPGETCDDGDGCNCMLLCDPATGGAIEAPKVKITRLDLPIGNEGFALSGNLRLSANTSGLSLSSLIASGLQIMVDDTGRDSQGVLDLSRRTVPVPGPGDAGECDPADSWTLAADGSSAIYKNASGRLPAGCSPGSARGLRKIKLTDERSTGGVIDVSVAVRGGSLAMPVGPLRAVVVLGTTDDASAGGRCGAANFGPQQCSSKGAGRQFSCDGR